MFKTITFRLGMAIAIVLCLIISLSAFLNYSKFEKIFSSLFQSRIEYLISDLKHTIEFSLTLGLPITDLKNTQDLLEKTKADDVQIRTVTVFDAAGKTLFSTDADRAGSPVSESWLGATRQQNLFWRILEEQELVMGANLRNAVDQTVGFIAVGYSRAYYDSILQGVRNDLIKMGGIVFAACLLGSGLLGVITLRPMTRRFLKIEQSLRGVLDPGIQPVPDSEMTSPMEREFLGIRNRFKNLFGEMDSLAETMTAAADTPPHASDSPKK